MPRFDIRASRQSVLHHPGLTTAGMLLACTGVFVLGWSLGHSSGTGDAADVRLLGTLVRGVRQGTQQRFSMECTPLPVEQGLTSPGPRLTTSGNKTFNPGAVYHPEKGWLVTLRHDPAHWGPGWVYTMQLGRDPNALDLRMGAATRKFMALDPETLDPGYPDKMNASYCKVHDLRPFLWKDKVYAGHAMWLGTGNHTRRWGYVHWQCISELDFDANVMKLEHCFDRMPYRHGIMYEKNWAFHEWDNMLLIMTEVAPCATYFRYVPAAFKGIEVVDRVCYGDVRVEIREATGMSMDDELHISGHMVDFPESLQALDASRQRLGEGVTLEDEWFLMAHAKGEGGQNYRHWGMRINKATLQITAVSRDAIISSNMLWPPLEVIVVFSYHFVKLGDTDALVLFYGKNDDSSCTATVNAQAIKWYRLPEGAGTHTDWTNTSAHNYDLTGRWW